MENLATYDFNPDIDKKVKEELQIADIPVIHLPSFMNTEVKTSYIGILNDFIFYRAWKYWVVHGPVALEHAEKIYSQMSDNKVRAHGHCGNINPVTECTNLLENTNGKQYVNTYHIDTQLGLCKFVKYVKNNILNNTEN